MGEITNARPALQICVEFLSAEAHSRRGPSISTFSRSTRCAHFWHYFVVFQLVLWLPVGIPTFGTAPISCLSSSLLPYPATWHSHIRMIVYVSFSMVFSCFFPSLFRSTGFAHGWK